MTGKFRIDWFRVIAELASAGVTPEKIEAEIGVPRRTIVDWKNIGHEPRYADGCRLIALWVRKTQRSAGDVPMQALEG